jgi:flagellar hook-basal body complex protein FliE
MNKQRRDRLNKIVSALEELKSQIDDICGEEQEAYDGMPESFQNGDKGDAMQNAISELESASSSIDDIIGNIDSAKGE